MELSYQYICKNKDDIPDDAYSHIDNFITENLGKTFSELFPLFAKTFHKTTSAIETNWSLPKLVLQKGLREWITLLVVQSIDKNLFFYLQPEFMEREGELFDEDHQMLPKSWVEIYRWFNSFCVTEKSYAVMNWWNTPFRYSARLDLDDYEKGSGASRKQTTEFSKAIGCDRNNLLCWLLTENEDAFFINENESNGSVYHVKGKNLDKFYKIRDPRKMLDDYLSFYLSGGNVAEYSFSKA